MRTGISSILVAFLLFGIVLTACQQRQKGIEDVLKAKHGRTQLVIVAGQNVQCHSCYTVIGMLNTIQSTCLDVVVVSNETREAEHEYFKKQFLRIQEHEVHYFFNNKLFDSIKVEYNFGGRLSYLVLGMDGEPLYVDSGEEFDFVAFNRAISENCQ